MPERSLAEALKKKLINNEAFTYAHLIKFERTKSIIRYLPPNGTAGLAR